MDLRNFLLIGKIFIFFRSFDFELEKKALVNLKKALQHTPVRMPTTFYLLARSSV